jgi:hypothetical protein
LTILERLGVEIGERRCGTPESARAADAVADAFRGLGLEPRFEELQFLGYEAKEPLLELDGERLRAGPCVYAHPTPPGGVEGRLRYLGVHPGVTGLFEPPAWAIEDAAGRELAKLFVNPLGGGAVPFTSAYGPVLTGPAAYVSSADGERLRDGATARLRVGGTFVPGRRDRNVLAELPGESAEAVVLCAHYDSVWRGPGVIDNASGVEGVVRVAERLRRRRLPRTVVLAAWCAEEVGLLGSRFHVLEAKTTGALGRIAGVVNLDCIARGEKLTIAAGPDELRGRAIELARRLGLLDRYELDAMGPGPGTDHYWFAVEGIPAASILFWPYPEYHLPDERLELVDERRLADAVDLAEALVESQLALPVRRGM